MKTILCFGDSNTWGWDPSTQERLPADARWPGVLREFLGQGFHVIEEGLNGRTTVWNDPLEAYRNGRDYLIPCLETHRPIDLVILMLGTNDLKARFSVNAYDIACGAGALVELVQSSASGPKGESPKILLMAPPPILETGDLADMFHGGQEKSKRLAYHYRLVAAELGCEFLDTSTVIESSPLDGIHFEPIEHQKLARRVAQLVQDILPASAH